MLALPPELLLSRANPVPPRAAINNLAHRGMVIPLVYVEPEECGRSLRHRVRILIIHDLVQLLQQFLVSSMQEIRLFQLLRVEHQTVAFRDRNAEVFE